MKIPNTIQTQKHTIAVMMVILLHSFALYGQVFSNDAGRREKLFIYEVKQIDEFFERFNDAPQSFIRDIYKERKIEFKISRQKLIKSLFNYDTGSWDPSMIDNFISDVNNPVAPIKLHFDHADWFAEAKCLFQTNKAVIEIPLVLQIAKDERNGLKWIIAAVGENSLKQSSQHWPVPQANGYRSFISPASHGTNFIELGKALEDKQNLSAYFASDLLNRRNALDFFWAIHSGTIRFLYVKDVRYHFLQIHNWIFTAEYFGRESLNAGWLISKLTKAPEKDKESYRRKLLRSLPGSN